MPTSGGAYQPATEAIIWVGVLIVLALALGITVMLVRKWMFSDGREQVDDAGLVASLRAARDRGEISQEEYEHTLRRIRGRLTGERRSTALPGGEQPPRTASAARSDRPDAAGERRAPPGVDLAGDPLPPRED